MTKTSERSCVMIVERCHGCGEPIPEDYTMAFKWVTHQDGTKEPLMYHLHCCPPSTKSRSYLTIHKRSLIGRVFRRLKAVWTT